MLCVLGGEGHGDADIVIIENDDKRDETSYEIIKAIDAKVIIVDNAVWSLGNGMTAASKSYGEYLLGAVLNKVPQSQIEQLRGQAPAAFANEGIDVLAVLPEDRTLLTLTIGEVAECIQGEILNNPEKRNSMTFDFFIQMLEVFSDIDDDPDIRVAIIKGEGKSFTAGLDLALLADLAQSTGADSREDLREVILKAQQSNTAIIQSRKPVI